LIKVNQNNNLMLSTRLKRIVTKKVKENIFYIKHLDEKAIKISDSLIKDIGLDSVEMFMLITDIEVGFGIKVSNLELLQLRTVNDVVELIVNELMNKRI